VPPDDPLRRSACTALHASQGEVPHGDAFWRSPASVPQGGKEICLLLASAVDQAHCSIKRLPPPERLVVGFRDVLQPGYAVTCDWWHDTAFHTVGHQRCVSITVVTAQSGQGVACRSTPSTWETSLRNAAS